VPVTGEWPIPKIASNYGYDATSESKPWPQEVNSIPQCNNARDIQTAGGYSSICYTTSYATDAFNRMANDNIFFFYGHGGFSSGGLITFHDSTSITADYGGLPNRISYYNNGELDDLILAVYLACYSATTGDYGNLLDESVNNGVHSALGFQSSVEIDRASWWADRFWYHLSQEETVHDAAANARDDTYWHLFSDGIFSTGGVESFVIKPDPDGGTIKVFPASAIDPYIIPTSTRIRHEFTEIVGTTPVSTDMIMPTDTASTPPTQHLPVLSDDTSQVESATVKPVLQQKALNPAVQRKISTNLLYLIDSNVPQGRTGRDVLQQQMETEGKFKTVTQDPSSCKADLCMVTTSSEPTENLVLVCIDFIPSVSTSAIDSYVSSVMERNEQEHSMVAWVNIDYINSIASLDTVSDIRSAEPSVTKDSPIYHDTKFVNNRADHHPATPEEAKESIRTFENEPGMVLTQKKSITTLPGEVYEMTSDNGRYLVNAHTGEVQLASFYGMQKKSIPSVPQLNSKDSSVAPGSDLITTDQAFVIARNYAAKHYRNFYCRTMVLFQSQLVDHSAGGKTYYFTWREKVNDVTVPNSVSITIDATDGNLLSYINIDQPVNADIIPSISKDQAVSAAISAFSPIDVFKSDANLAVIIDDDNTQRLVWSVEINGRSNNNSIVGGHVLIDAKSGTIVMRDSFI